MRIGLFAACSCTALVAGLAGTATAQVAADAEDTTVRLETITVETQRRTETAQEVPIALTPLDTAAIERLQARDIRDISSLVPNVQLSPINTGPSASAVSIRGVNSQDPERSFDPAVGTFVDGVYIGTNAFNLLDTFDLERIEVLRGPQGTLYGRNTTGGAISATRTRPTMENGFRGKLGFGNEGRVDVKGVANFAVVEDQVGLKIGGFSETDDGFYENNAGGSEGAVDRWAATAALLFQPASNLDIYLAYDHAEDQSDISPYIPLNVATASPLPFIVTGAPPAGTTVTPGFGPDALCLVANGTCTQSVSSSTGPHMIDSSNDALTLNLDWGVSEDFDLTVIAGWRSNEEDVFLEFDAVPEKAFEVVRTQEYEQISFEGRIASNFEGRFNFVAGAYYFESEYTLDQAIYLDLALVAPIPVVGVAAVAGSGDDDFFEAETSAIFAQGDFDVTEDLTITVGGRMSWDDRAVSTRFRGSPAALADPFSAAALAYSVADGVPADRPITSEGAASDSWAEFTPKIGFEYSASEGVLIYGSYSRGYNAGGFSARAGTVADVTTPFDPEFVNAYEIGFKSDFADGRARLNGAVFFNEYEDKQEEAIQPAPPPTFTSTTVRNAAEAEIYGVELEGSFLFTDSFRVDASLGYLNAEYTDYPAFAAAAQLIATPALPAGTLIAADFSPLELRRAPEYTASLSPRYEAEVGGGLLSIGGTMRYTDEFFYEVFNDQRGLIDATTIFDAFVTYDFGGPTGDRYSIGVYGKNLTDEDDPISFVNSVVDFGTTPLPAQYGVEFGINY